MILKNCIRSIAKKLGLLYLARKLLYAFSGRIERKFVSRIVKPGDLVFDVGANRGQSSRCYISLGARSIAFEPQHNLHNDIRECCGFSKQLSIDSSALGAKTENRKMFMTEYDQLASLRNDWEGRRIGETTISVSTLDAKITEYGKPRYCKIDVEGWEFEVVSGLSQAIDIISFEYHLYEDETARVKKVLSRLAELGDYWCNIRENSSQNFLLPEFMKISDFSVRFPEQLGQTLEKNYGDIYAVLNPRDIVGLS